MRGVAARAVALAFIGVGCHTLPLAFIRVMCQARGMNMNRTTTEVPPYGAPLGPSPAPAKKKRGRVKTAAIVGGAFIFGIMIGNAGDGGSGTVATTAPAPTVTVTAPAPAPVTVTTPAAAPAAPATSAPAGCGTASEGVTAAIKEGINNSTVSVGRAAVVHDPEHDVYYAAAELHFSDGVTDVAVWETSQDDGTGYMHSAEALAKSFSNYPQMYADASTPGVKAARACLK